MIEPTFNSFSENLRNEQVMVIVPFHLVDGFILIDAQVNDVNGKFLLDTGSPYDFLLNSEKIGLDNSSLIAEGAASSGQKIIVHKSDEPISISIVGFSGTTHKEGGLHTKLNFIADGLGVNIIGFLGYGFLKDHEFSIDYDKQLISLHLVDDNGDPVKNKTLAQSHKKGVISFENNNNINIPEVEVNIGNQKIPAYFDTGSRGSISLTEALQNLLMQNECIKQTKGFRYGAKQDSITTIHLKGISIQEIDLGRLGNLRLEKGEPQLTLGYSFLKNYISVWNYKKRTIELISMPGESCEFT